MARTLRDFFSSSGTVGTGASVVVSAVVVSSVVVSAVVVWAVVGVGVVASVVVVVAQEEINP